MHLVEHGSLHIEKFVDNHRNVDTVKFAEQVTLKKKAKTITEDIYG